MLLPGFRRGERRQRQGVDALLHFVGERRVDAALPLDTRQALKTVGYDAHVEMRFPFGPRSGMTLMARALGYTVEPGPEGSSPHAPTALDIVVREL